MSSSDVEQPRPRRLWRWLAILVGLLAVVYGVGWFVIAGKIEERIDVSLARLAENGVVASCANRDVGGFPLGLSLRCDSIDYDDPARGISFNVGTLATQTATYNPLRTDVTLEAPLRLATPNVPPIAVSWDRMSATAHLWRPVPSEISISTDGLSAETDPDDETQPAKLFAASMIKGVLTPHDSDLVWNGSFDDLRLDPALVEGRTLPPLAGQADITLADGVVFMTDRPRSLRGQSFTIGNLALLAGDGSVAISGPISIDDAGLVDAALEIKLINPPAISAILQAAMPEKASEIRTAFIGLGFLGPEPSIPFRIVKGRPMLLGFALGEIKPLR